MPSNDQIIKDILALDKTVETEGLSNAQLLAKLKELKEPEEVKPPFSVPAGKSVTTKRGIISDAEVKAADFEGGEATLNCLVKSGYVVKA